MFPIAIGLLVLWILVRRGALSRRAFERVPVRAGSLGLGDILAVGALFVLGPSAVMPLLGPPADQNPSSVTLREMIATQLGLIPAVLYTLLRAAAAVCGGVAGLGLGLTAIPRSIGRALLVSLAVLPLFVALSSLVMLILMVLGRPPVAIAHQVLEVMVQEDRSAPNWWALAFCAVVGAPVLEEIIFRGMVQTALLQSRVIVNRWTAIALTAVLFSAIHSSVTTPHALPPLYLLGVGLGWTYERWGTLWTPIFVHAIFNTVNIAAAVAGRGAG